MIDYYSDDLTFEDVMTIAHLNSMSPKLRVLQSDTFLFSRDNYFALCSTNKAVFIIQIHRHYLVKEDRFLWDTNWFMLDPSGLPPNAVSQISDEYKHQLASEINKYFVFYESGPEITVTPFGEFGGTYNFLSDIGNLLNERHTRKVLERNKNNILR